MKDILERCDIGIKVITTAPPRLNDMNKILQKIMKKNSFFSFSPNNAVPGPMNVQSKEQFNFDFKWKNLFFILI